MPFEITDWTEVHLSSVTPRTEKHGDDDVLAISMSLHVEAPNTFLDALDPTLRTMLWRAKEPDTDELPGIEPQPLTIPCSASIEDIKLKQCFEGWTLHIDHGIDEDDPITLGSCKVDKFRVIPKAYGMCEVSFRIGTNDLDATEVGIICSKLHQAISISLAAPKPKPEAIDGTVGHPGAARREDGEPEAGDLFAAAHGGEADPEDDEGPL